MANQISNKVIENTLVDYPRLHKIQELLASTSELPGMIAEVGVYKGGTARLILENTTKKVLLFDTFSGLPDVDSQKDTHHKGDFKDTSYETVHELLQPYVNFFMFEGIFPDDSWGMIYRKAFQFSLAHVDCDIYPSVKASLQYFYERMVPGGVIILDDYNAPTCPGAKQATDEFMADKPEKVTPTCQCQAIIIKAT